MQTTSLRTPREPGAFEAPLKTPAVTPLETKTHYEVLDGLRGVAALIVVAFHTFEEFSYGDHVKQILNHGYLAVDFFFLLSGFVVAYAYDDRWGRMSLTDFFKRRLIRLQPMVIMGSLIGALLFYLAAGPVFPKIANTPVWQLALVALLGATLLPLPYQLDVRGWFEMHPLDGPAWSLFFEYIANVLYAVGLRKLSNRVLGVLTALAAILLVEVALRQGDVIGGWSTSIAQLHIGFARLLFPFFAGMLLMRSGRRVHIPGAFGWASLLLALCLCLPRVGGYAHPWLNGVYDSVCILILFPLIVAIGAGSGKSAGSTTGNRLANWLGGISYPLYITHYPLIYIWTAWVDGPQHPSGHSAKAWLLGIGLFVTAVCIGYLCLRFYDEPVRRWLSRRFLGKTTTATSPGNAAA